VGIATILHPFVSEGTCLTTCSWSLACQRVLRPPFRFLLQHLGHDSTTCAAPSGGNQAVFLVRSSSPFSPHLFKNLSSLADHGCPHPGGSR